MHADLKGGGEVVFFFIDSDLIKAFVTSLTLDTVGMKALEF